MRPARFVQQLREITFVDTFNPYSDRCEVHDREDAPSLRARSLESVLSRASECEIDSLWLGRDLGYRGGRRTGLALTDDVHIAAHGARWEVAVVRPTKGEAVAERTAAVVWRLLHKIEKPIFLWNVFPFHPHEHGAPFTNRAHSRAEKAAGEAILSELVRLLRPRRIIGLGNDAAAAALRIAPQHTAFAVRHPSYGGQPEFIRQVAALYELTDGQHQPQLI